jgi:hypothetical protein
MRNNRIATIEADIQTRTANPLPDNLRKPSPRSAPPRSQLEPSRVEIESLNGILLSFNDITDRAVRGAGVTDQPRRNGRQCLNIFARPLTAGTNCANAYNRCACQTLSAQHHRC